MSDPASARGLHAPTGLAVARRALVDWVRAAGPEGSIFLQAHLRANAGGNFSVRHVDDRAIPDAQLERISDPIQARRVAQTDASGAHRPLKTAPDLRRGWLFEALDEQGLWTVLDYLYPACVAHWYAGLEGSLRVTSWGDTAGRQSGMYSVVKLLPPEAVRDVALACCGDGACLRRVAWGIDGSDPEPVLSPTPDDSDPDGPALGAVVPCPEACSMFISFARSVLRVERSPRHEVAGLGRLNEAELEQIRALVAAAADGEAVPPREGEFDAPLNRRRLRYLAIRLDAAAAEGEPKGM